ncbi:MAG: ABC transporter substrate-binding protein [Gammaproteobacteria bacterium]|nr:ABC transporter substrate-binding protein [Gammaproteobacteria bacterium]
MFTKTTQYLLSLAVLSGTAIADQAAFDQLSQDAKDQTVYFHAWGGADSINQYIQWAADEVESRYGVTVEHVKIDDAAAVVSRLLVEKQADKSEGGDVDLMWVNGENFHTLQREGLLADGWTHKLPNMQFTDPDDLSLSFDFGVKVEQQEAPWGRAQLVFFADPTATPDLPTSAAELLAYAEANPGRVSYPRPPQFHGTTFLKQMLSELIDDRSVLNQPADTVDAAAITAPLWGYLDQLHPHLWQQADSFPQDAGAMLQMLDDGVLDIALSFNPSEASQAIADGRLNPDVRSYVHSAGTIGNTHFVAIPFNANAPEGAKVFANFLMSPEAQARKADPNVWGDPTVLDIERLSAEDQARFAALEQGVATLSPAELGRPLPEPHPSWVPVLERLWAERYQP